MFGHKRRPLLSHAFKKCDLGVGKVSTWVGRVMVRVCIANRTENLRHGPRVNGGKEEKKQVSSRKGKGRRNRCKKDRKKTTDKRGEENDSRRKLKIGFDRGTEVDLPRTNAKEQR